MRENDVFEIKLEIYQEIIPIVQAFLMQQQSFFYKESLIFKDTKLIACKLDKERRFKLIFHNA